MNRRTWEDSQPVFSLIVATRDRVREVSELLKSLAVQDFESHIPFEVIVVDGNTDDRLASVVAPYADRLDLRHYRFVGSVSAGRNFGQALARGEIIAFPDDDCSYPPYLLAQVDRFFRENRAVDFISTSTIDPRFHVSYIYPAPHDKTAFGRRDLFGCAFTNFYRDRCLDGVWHDESMGPGSGTPIGSYEDSDFTCQAIRRGRLGVYLREPIVYHPLKLPELTRRYFRRKLSYGGGYGYFYWKVFRDGECGFAVAQMLVKLLEPARLLFKPLPALAQSVYAVGALRGFLYGICSYRKGRKIREGVEAALAFEESSARPNAVKSLQR